MSTLTQQQIDRLKSNVSNALTAIADKGVTVPADAISDHMASLIRLIESGGTNFSVSAYSALPGTGGENEIAIITDTAIPTWTFSVSKPATRSDGTALESGDLWVQTGGANVSFNALGDNGLIIQPYRAMQYIDGAWVQKDAYIYQSGEWVPWTVYLFHNGVTNEVLTGGINAQSITDGAIYYYGTVTSSSNRTYTTVKPIDLTNVNYIKARMMSPNTLASIYFRLLVGDSERNAANVTTSSLTAYVQESSPFNGEEREVVLDVSALTGEFYIGYCWGVLSSSSGSRTITGYIYDWWVE